MGQVAVGGTRRRDTGPSARILPKRAQSGVAEARQKRQRRLLLRFRCVDAAVIAQFLRRAGLRFARVCTNVASAMDRVGTAPDRHNLRWLAIESRPPSRHHWGVAVETEHHLPLFVVVEDVDSKLLVRTRRV